IAQDGRVLPLRWAVSSLGTGFAASDGTADAELAHAGLQSGALYAEKICSAAGAGNTPLRLAEGAEDVLAVGFFQSGDGCWCWWRIRGRRSKARGLRLRGG